jgi:hypothetical protein
MVELLAKKNAFLQDIAFAAGQHAYGATSSSGRMALPEPRVALDQPGHRREQVAGRLLRGEGWHRSRACPRSTSPWPSCTEAAPPRSALTRTTRSSRRSVIEVARALFYECTDTNPDRSPRHDAAVRRDRRGRRSVHQAPTLAQARAGLQLLDLAGRLGARHRLRLLPEERRGRLPLRKDMGKQLVKDANNKEYIAYVTHHKWQPRLVREGLPPGGPRREPAELSRHRRCRART